ncbi:MAG: hypothetical protein F6J86_02520 [Symploca sp. SIO1B1]|nr:hypothetical protein [Symploca sp. SIO1C2]NER92728.1 hypothetical protein [Symploca sp. SIO1B1]
MITWQQNQQLRIAIKYLCTGARCELLGIVLSLPLMLLAGQAALHNKQDFGDVPYTYINKGAIAVDWKTTGQKIILALVFAVVALGIITFATRSAMGF